MPSTEDVARRSTSYNDRILQWNKIRDVLEGEDQVRAKRDVYMPRPKGQDLEAYERYVARATFYGVADRTALGLVGLVFRVAPTTTLAPQIEDLEESASPDGFPLDTLLRTATREVLTLGRFGLLVDLGQGEQSIAETRPFLAPFPAESIWRWDEILDPDRGVRHLVRVIVEEEPADNDGKMVVHLRELYLDVEFKDEANPELGVSAVYRQQMWRSKSSDQVQLARRHVATSTPNERSLRELDFEKVGPPITPMMNNAPLTRIPFWFINTYNMLPRPEKPPMLDLANMNLAHWRNSADYEQLLHLVGSPTPWVAENWEAAPDGGPKTIGAGTFWRLTTEGKAGLLEFDGNSAEAFVKAMADKESRMAALGARLIQSHERSNVTAETQRIQTLGETSVLSSAVQNVEMAFTVALRFAAEWAGASEAQVEETGVELNHDFVESRMDPSELKELVAAWQAGAFSRQTLHENLQRGEIMNPKRTVDEELELIEAETPDEPPALTEEPPIEEDPEEGEEGDDPSSAEPTGAAPERDGGPEA